MEMMIPEQLTESQYQKAVRKSQAFEFFALTQQDHEDMESTPPDELVQNPGKAQYEVMSEEEILSYLDNALETMRDPVFIKTGYARIQKDFFTKSLPFLESVGRLPKKYLGFDLSTLPNL